jgi:PKHD-type hydroxylase
MYNIINNILTKEQLIEIIQLLQTSTYVEGKLTAGVFAQKVKNNKQIIPNDSLKLTNIIMPIVLANKEFQCKSLYKVINEPIFAKYTKDMQYGLHTDDPIMNSRHGPFRTDLAMTLFLNEPSEYEGGELCVENNEFKLSAGSLLLYSANNLHQVKPVINGTRYVMVNWCQSIIKDSMHREILINLETARTDPTFENINDIYSKLMRIWADL